MKQCEISSLVVTCCFLGVLLAFVAVGVSPVDPAVEPVASPGLERYGADAQFLQYLEYRVVLENSSNCQ